MNILTFDIEEWFHANFIENIGDYKFNDSNFEKNMDALLLMCERNNAKATFFVLGTIGENYSHIVKRIADEGHEVASHGYSHELAYNQTKFQFKEDVRKSIQILEDIIGKKVFGYRAPSWSILRGNIDYLETLQELGLKYDASIFPVQNFLYGIPDINREIHKPFVNGKQLDLFEVPTSVFDFLGKGMGYSGGFYLRFFPRSFIKSQIRKSNKENKPAIVYLHPREIDPTEKKLKLPFKEGLIHFHNIKGTFDKLDNITKSFEFTSVSKYLNL